MNIVITLLENVNKPQTSANNLSLNVVILLLKIEATKSLPLHAKQEIH
jgi:hypothetical protein